MISTPKDWTDETTRTGKVDYRLLAPVFSDVYTGRILSAKEAPALRKSFSNIDLETVQPSQYRPPRQKDDWKPKAPQAGTRTNPMTLESEPRVFPKSYGCDGGVDYGLLYTMRSGTPAFYDKQLESGTINISGPRSGCTNSIIPANGSSPASFRVAVLPTKPTARIRAAYSPKPPPSAGGNCKCTLRKSREDSTIHLLGSI